MPGKPRAYNIDDAEEMKRLHHELRGYMRISVKDGTDRKGREFALKALEDIVKRDESKNRNEPWTGLPMHDCFWVPGLSCSAKPTMCDRTKFDFHCVMAGIKQLGIGINEKREYAKKEGMQDILLWMMEADHLPDEFINNSVDDVIGEYERWKALK